MRDSLALVGRGLKRIWGNTSGLKSHRDKVAWEMKRLTNLPNNLVTKCLYCRFAGQRARSPMYDVGAEGGRLLLIVEERRRADVPHQVMC